MTPLCAHAAILGHVVLPNDLMPSVGNREISNIYGTLAGRTAADGSYQIPYARNNDIDILFIKDPKNGDILLMGYAYDNMANLSIEGTALAMLLMFNPANGILSMPKKLQLLENYRKQDEFIPLMKSIEKKLRDYGRVSTMADKDIIEMVSKIQKNVAQPKKPPFEETAPAVSSDKE